MVEKIYLYIFFLKLQSSSLGCQIAPSCSNLLSEKKLIHVIGLGVKRFLDNFKRKGLAQKPVSEIPPTPKMSGVQELETDVLTLFIFFSARKTVKNAILLLRRISLTPALCAAFTINTTLTQFCSDLCSPSPVADPGFSPGGCANSQNCYYFSNFCQKLHENERIWTPGGARPWRPPLDPPMFTVIKVTLIDAVR